MKIKDFGVEIWMNAYENDCRYNIAETCVFPLTVDEVIDLSGDRIATIQKLGNMQLSYGSIEGLEALRSQIASLYEKADKDNVLTMHGAIGANNLTIETIVEPGDHVISVLPTYQQHYSIPEAIGAEVSILRLHPENNWLPDLDELKNMMRSNTKLVCINNPNNPSGSLMDEALLRAIVDIVREKGAYLLCDEVYRGLNHEGAYFSKSIFDLYEKGISTGSMSKTFSLAGLRLGWITCPKELKEKLLKHRDYNTISCGMIDEFLANIALENKNYILERNRKIVTNNLSLLDDWIKTHPHFCYVKPLAGTTAFVHFDYAMSSVEFCQRLLETRGVMLVPGTALDVESYLRFGYANKTSEIEEGLKQLSLFVEQDLKDFPTR